MTEPNLMQKIGATPGKLALVGVLAVVLIAVIAGQLPDQSASSAVALNRPALSRTESTRQPTVINPSAPKMPLSDSPETQPPGTWPELPLENIVAYDPLAAPDWLVAAQSVTRPENSKNQLLAEAERQKRSAAVLEKLRRQGTKAVVISAGEKRAIIGEQSVHIGDSIEGFLVTDITKQGIVLTETK